MKFIKKCPVFLILTVSGLLLSMIGVAGRTTIDKDRQFDMLRRPFLSLVFEAIGSRDYGAGSGSTEEAGQKAAVTQKPGEGQSIEDFKTAKDTGNEIQTIEKETPEETVNADQEKPGAVYNFTAVTEDYFNDAVFIGDSRTVGLYEYGGMEERADFLAKISLTIYDVFTEPVIKDEETGKKITVEEALSKKKYGKVYLMLGINELGTGTLETFMEEYRSVVERLKQLQPDAIIFVEGIMRVTGDKNENDPIFNNTNINERNEAIARLADNKDIFYIDVNEAVCDEEGNLNKEYTIDEIHLKAKYYEIWKQFLLEHGVVRQP